MDRHLEREVEAIKAGINSLLDALVEKIQDNYDKTVDLEEEIDDLKKRIDSLEEDRRDLQSQISDLKYELTFKE